MRLGRGRFAGATQFVRRTKESARNSKSLAFADGLRALGQARLSSTESERLERIALAARRFAFAERPGFIRRFCAPWYDQRRPDKWRNCRIGWKRYGPGFGNILVERDLETSLILKEPTERERGVIYVSFEYNLMRLVASGRFPEIQRRYWLMCSTSWSPMDYCIVGNALAEDGAPLFLGISHNVDLANLEALAPRVVALPLLASDWLRPDGYQPRPRAERDVDIVMVANWTVFKRHWLLFNALRSMPPDLKIVLIGRDGYGRTADTIRREASQWGAPQHMELLTDIPHDQVRDWLCRAKVSAILSFREGSCVAVTEAMLADTPVVMMKDGHVGSARYISDPTGRFATPDTLASALMGYIDGSIPCAPRAAISERAVADRSSAALNAALRDVALARREPWTTDAAPLCWDGVPGYLHEADKQRLAPAYDAFKSQFGLDFKGPSSRSRRET